MVVSETVTEGAGDSGVAGVKISGVGEGVELFDTVGLGVAVIVADG